MKIRNKLLFLFSLLVVSILLIFTTWIYIFSSHYRKSTYYSRLQDKANTSAQLLFNVEEVNEALLKIIDKNTLALFQEQTYIVSDKNELIYYIPDETVPAIDSLLIKKIREQKKVEFSEKKRDGLGILYNNNDADYVVVISAYDKYGIAKITNLKIGLIIGLIVSLIFAVIIGRFYVRRTLLPISKVINQVNNITVSNLSLRVDEGNKTDEIAQLAITFNQMLQRIEDAFILQREFVSNATHELRTPFAVLLAEIDYILMQEREREEYKNVLESLAKEIKKLSKLSNGLLDLARISFDKSTFYLRSIRIDELLIEVCNTVISENSKLRVNLNFDSFPENEEQLSVFGNEQLLMIALKNIIDNACKFSGSKPIRVELKSDDENVKIQISDQGIGIPEEDIENIFQPFYRGKNANYTAGYGIGLALTFKIIELHNGKISVESEVSKGSMFTTVLPNRLHF